MSTIPTPSPEPILAAMDLFWERGYVATSLSDLLTRMKVSRKRIYSTYGSKEALFQAALQTYVEREAGPRMACLRGPQSGLKAIESYLQSWQFGPNFRGCLLWNSVAESENLSSEALAIVSTHFQQLENALLENLISAKNRGEIQRKDSASSLAHQVLSTAMGLSLMGKLVGDPSSSKGTVENVMACLRAGQQESQPATAC